MGDEVQQFAHFDLNPQFLPQLPAQTLLKGFARLAFATGKLPQTAEMLLWPALGDEQVAIARDEAGGHFNGVLRYEG